MLLVRRVQRSDPDPESRLILYRRLGHAFIVCKTNTHNFAAPWYNAIQNQIVVDTCECTLELIHIISMIPLAEEALLAGLSHDNYEAAQLSAAFWETVWPKLLECGWEKKVSVVII